MLDSMPHNLYTINMHYLRHMKDIIINFGVPRSIRCRAMERAIGIVDNFVSP